MTNISAIRAALRAKFGARRYRIERDGTIHAWGQMPNTSMTSWYIYGWVGDAQTLHRLGLAP